MRRTVVALGVPLGVAVVVAIAAFTACFPTYDFADTGGDGALPDGASLDGSVADDARPHPGQGDDGGANGGDALADAVAVDAGPFDASGTVLIQGGSVTITGQPETLTHAFFVDTYEVTVGRFKGWLDA